MAESLGTWVIQLSLKSGTTHWTVPGVGIKPRWSRTSPGLWMLVAPPGRIFPGAVRMAFQFPFPRITTTFAPAGTTITAMAVMSFHSGNTKLAARRNFHKLALAVGGRVFRGCIPDGFDDRPLEPVTSECTSRIEADPTVVCTVKLEGALEFSHFDGIEQPIGLPDVLGGLGGHQLWRRNRVLRSPELVPMVKDRRILRARQKRQ